MIHGAPGFVDKKNEVPLISYDRKIPTDDFETSLFDQSDNIMYNIHTRIS